MHTVLAEDQSFAPRIQARWLTTDLTSSPGDRMLLVSASMHTHVHRSIIKNKILFIKKKKASLAVVVHTFNPALRSSGFVQFTRKINGSHCPSFFFLFKRKGQNINETFLFVGYKLKPNPETCVLNRSAQVSS